MSFAEINGDVRGERHRAATRMTATTHAPHSDSSSSVSDSDTDDCEVSTNRTETTSASAGSVSAPTQQQPPAHKNNVHYKDNTYSKRKSRLQRKDTNHYYRCAAAGVSEQCCFLCFYGWIPSLLNDEIRCLSSNFRNCVVANEGF